MKLVYLVPDVNNEGGVARVLQIKVNYFIEKFNYEIHIITQNSGSSNPFYSFHKNVNFYDLTLNKSKINFLFSFKKQLAKLIKNIEPNLIIVADNGYKGYLVPFLLKTKVSIIFESHNSIYLQLSKNETILKKYFNYYYRLFFAQFFTKFITLSKTSKQEWKLVNAMVIANPIPENYGFKTNLQNKKVIAVGRHVFEKGFDDLLHIWKEILVDLPDYH